METKVFEVRDRATHLGVMCTMMKSDNPNERYELRRGGYGEMCPMMMMVPLSYPAYATYDEFVIADKLPRVDIAFRYIRSNWDALQTGAVVDIRYINGETPEPCKSDRYYVWGGTEA